jgi:uncharacterized protein involved in outer membrane biogenesis
MMIVRFLMVLVGLFLIGVAVAAVAATPYWEPLLREELSARLGAILQTDASIGKLLLDPQRQAIVLQDVILRNPPAFEKGDALHCPRVLLVINPLNLFGEHLRVEQIIVEDAAVALRWTPGQGTNVGALTAQARMQATPATPGVPVPPEGRSIRVGSITCTNAKVTPQNPVLGALPLGLDVAPFTVSGLEEKGPLRPGQITGIFLKSLLREMITLKGLLSPVTDLLQREAAATA